MREKAILHGLRVGKWIVIDEGNMLGGKRYLKCRCLACGRVEDFRADKLTSGQVINCSCYKTIPPVLLSGEGYACLSRETNSRKCPTQENKRGFCCYHCSKKSQCAYACLNTPDKCTSFFYRPRTK